MPILYETLSPKIGREDVFTIGFEVDVTLDRKEILKRLKTYNWTHHGLELLSAKIERTYPHVKGTLVFKSLKSFVVWWVLLVPAIGGAIGVIGGVLKLWLVKEVVSPWIAPGPLGLPVVAWVFISAGAVIIPILILMKRK